ncbi:hypothetical protein AYO21_09595 [Fonsecaea monophora]|uniref:Oxysterol-binding protein n=1 Tax=Fonsecaea monophora TaxID=254056 RepID=A0A177EXT6_9EURO|nr:hypothetical protein AYO21_09595 [Fonsecaea monophora]KAH0845498.1 putative oxysterol-binding protein [Fonsecaea pedrosoi]OAG36201.1 hypothetical protein AYO21_09595 [Fonsecaea monophora]
MTSTSNTPFATPATSNPNTRPPTPTPSATPTGTTVPADNDLRDDSSKLRTFLGLLKKFIGVSDIANVRFSLPSQLIEPIPNLEYWHYLDRPETFVSIGRSDEPLGRMLEVLRFWFTKDLVSEQFFAVCLCLRLKEHAQKYVKGKPCKPYNSTLGEFFRCHWEVNSDAPPISNPSKAPPQPSVDPTEPQANGNTSEEPVRISFLTEQTSHHPPVSAYWYECPSRGIIARGYDQISAKFTGTSVRVIPGVYNRGIFVTLTQRDNEEYQLVHPAASLGGLLRGSLYISVADTCSITCPKTRLKCLLTYVEESWFGKAQNRVHGLIFRYDPSDDKYTRVKDVPEKDILAKLEGCWQEQIVYTIPNSAAVKETPNIEPTSDKQLLIDLQPLFPVPKSCPPPHEQLPHESRTFWAEVTTAINEKRYSDATRMKQDLEQAQRDKAAKRKDLNVEFKPRFFTSPTEPNGKPELTEYGKEVLAGLEKKEYGIDFVPEPGIDADT